MAEFVIVVLDGDWACQDLLAEALADAGYHPVLWDTRTDAHDLIERTRPDLVILDTWLQERDDGWKLLQRMGRTPATASIPAIVCSSDPQLCDEEMPRDMEQCVAVLAKPFALTDLLVSIRQVVSEGRTCAGGE